MSPDGSVKSPPEERLLRLIRGAAKTAGRPQPAGAAGSSPALPAARWRALPWPGLAIGGLGLLLGLELLTILVQALRPLPVVQAPQLPPAAPVAAAPAAPLEPLANLPSLTDATHPVFRTSGVPAASSGATGRAASGAARGLVARLTLMGIVSGEPAQAIIEDAQTKKTYFVSVGQMVVDGAVLEDVLDNRVVLVLDGERVELSL